MFKKSSLQKSSIIQYVTKNQNSFIICGLILCQLINSGNVHGVIIRIKDNISIPLLMELHSVADGAPSQSSVQETYVHKKETPEQYRQRKERENREYQARQERREREKREYEMRQERRKREQQVRRTAELNKEASNLGIPSWYSDIDKKKAINQKRKEERDASHAAFLARRSKWSFGTSDDRSGYRIGSTSDPSEARRIVQDEEERRKRGSNSALRGAEARRYNEAYNTVYGYTYRSPEGWEVTTAGCGK